MAGRATTVSVAQLGVDESTGDVTLPADRPVPTRYRADAVLTEPTGDQLRTADPLPWTGTAGYRLPPALQAFADSATRGEPPGTAKLLALYRAFADSRDFRYDEAQEAPGGHGLYQLNRLLTDRRGTAEQYASAYAVLARHLGYDARVVMGLRPRYGADGSFTATGRDVDAWAEVDLAGLGWVTIDPSPRANPVGSRGGAATGSAPRSGGTDPVRDAARDPDTAAPEPPQALPPTPTSSASRGWSGWLVGAALVVALLLLGVPVVPAAKGVRRYRRRTARDPRAVALGAWRETVDRLRDVGLPVHPGRTTAETLAAVAEAGGDRLLPTLSELATLTDRALYAPEQPAGDTPVLAWVASRSVLRHAYARTGLLRRWAGRLDPRTLR